MKKEKYLSPQLNISEFISDDIMDVSTTDPIEPVEEYGVASYGINTYDLVETEFDFDL